MTDDNDKVVYLEQWQKLAKDQKWTKEDKARMKLTDKLEALASHHPVKRRIKLAMMLAGRAAFELDERDGLLFCKVMKVVIEVYGHD
jgi:hypothetical protein